MQDRKMRMKRKKRNTFILLAVILMVATMVGIFIWKEKSPVVARVNDYEVTVEELQLFMDIYKSEVSGNLKETYNITLDRKSYEEKAGDKTALQYWKDYGFERLLRYKIEQQLAVEQGVLESSDILFSSFKKSYKGENKRRDSAIKRGEVVYGARQYTMQSYYRYQYSNMQIDLIDKLFTRGGVLSASKEQLQEYYLVHKEDYKELDSYVFDQYLWEESQNLTEAEQKEIYEAINKGQQGMDVLNKYHIEKNQIELNQDNYRGLSKESNEIYEIALNMKAGEISDLIPYQNSFMILKCESREEGEYGEFEEYQEEVEANYKQETYEQYIDTLVQKANVEFCTRYESYRPN